MAEKMQVYKCELCGNIVEVFHGGAGELVCCGEPMILLEEQNADWKTEKHVPVINQEGDEVKVVVGSTPHPMTEEHHIEWIELACDCGQVYRQELNPGDAPEAVFAYCEDCKGNLYAREYCNVHGLWSTKE
ncbi:MAG: desulfoferrodoxin [Candidatus Krumholzibacteriota bacterium]|nr:desulfoferrodoxin [Candidatus Krumholzibacteriota bacterium]